MENQSRTIGLINNATCGLILLNGELSKWVKDSPLNNKDNNLIFVLQVESSSNGEAYITLDYDDDVYKETINAVYIGGELKKKEREYVKTFLPLTDHSFKKKGICEPILDKIQGHGAPFTLKNTIAQSLHNLVSYLLTNDMIQAAKIGFSNNSVILFIKYNDNSISKVEFYLDDILGMLERINKHRTSLVREVTRNILKIEI